jgi:hypothetical protein
MRWANRDRVKGEKMDRWKKNKKERENEENRDTMRESSVREDVRYDGL